MIARAAELVTVASGGGLVLLAQVPGVPNDFQEWPVAAIMGLVTLAALAILLFVVRGAIKAMTDSAAALGRMAETQAEANRLAAEQAKKAGETNQFLAEVVTELRVRPCMATPGKTKTQRIS